MTESSEYDYFRIAKAINFVQENFRDQPGLEEIADAAHLSPHHFQRMFTSWAGISPKKYLQYISASFAKTLMKGGNFTLSNIAYATGLSGTSRLHDLFITLEAMTPGIYKSGGESVNIKYGFYPTPFGEILLANTDKGICKLSFVTKKELDGDKAVPMRISALSELKEEFPNANIQEDGGSCELLVKRIFSPELFSDSSEMIRLNVKGTPFQVKVWEALLKIPVGELASYNQVAEVIRKPTASRAVGSAIGKNPVAVLIPCHRVIRQAGGIGGYRWDPTRKMTILNWEQCQVFDEQLIAS